MAIFKPLKDTSMLVVELVEIHGWHGEDLYYSNFV